MQDWVTAYAPLVGRILLGGYFLLRGIQASLYFPAAVAQLIGLGLLNAAIPAAIAIIIIETLGGIALVLGMYTRVVALALTLYVAFIATLSGVSGDMTTQLALAGSLLYVAGTTKPRR